MQNSVTAWMTLAVVLMVILACTGASVPTSSPDTISTIVAATMAAAPTITAVPSASPTVVLPTLLVPTLPPTEVSGPPTLPAVIVAPTLPAATRITFLPDATQGVVTGTISPGQTINYVLQASQGQIMMVNVDSTNHDVTVSIKTQGGTSMLGASAHQSTWQQTLPQTEDYYLTLHGGASAESYILSVVIPYRIKFQAGADTVKLNGSTAGGFIVSYAAFAAKGQKMSVELGDLSGEAALTIYGYTDGTPYVRYVSEHTSFTFSLPSTQDYIIEVVPKAGSTVKYLLNVKIL